MKKLIPDIRDVFTFSGLALFGYGLYMIYPACAFIAIGAFFVWLGLGGD